MSTIKTKIQKEKVINFLQNHFQENISNLTSVEGGEISQAFSFHKKSKDFVIRINSRSDGFEKDKYAFEHFSTAVIPIPKVLEIGRFDNMYYYAISEKAQGKILQNLSDAEYKETFPELFDILNSIHNISIPEVSGFGCWSIDGSMETKTWKDYVLAVDKYAVGSVDKPSLFETSFLEKDIWDDTYKQMKLLLSYCPEDKYLIHGDYGTDNVTANQAKITGVFDWEGSKYGDFLYDIAWLNFWNPERNSMTFFKDYYTKVKPEKNFEERVLCYQLRIGLSSLSFYATSSQKEKYESTKNKLMRLMEHGE